MRRVDKRRREEGSYAQRSIHETPEESLMRLSARNLAKKPAESLAFLESHQQKYVEVSKICAEAISIDVNGLAKEEIFNNVTRHVQLKPK